MSRSTVTGIKELREAFKRVPRVIQNGLPDAVRASLSPYASAMRKLLKPRIRSGLLYQSIKPRIIKYPSGVVFGIVGPSRDVAGEYRGKREVPGNIAHLVELGTRPHAIGKGSYKFRSGKSQAEVQTGYLHPGAKPHPFGAPAFASAAAESLRNADAKVQALLDKSVEGLK